ncbi:protein kinase domain-containing protein [Actinoplanes sp. CA-252034]|uniref:serine/threonine-protein kinase n=1 Tax=Actinoplanes sp. CA-252034 TaxID=3239906 RepID=UPI003D98601B
MGRVWAARDELLARDVAVKEVVPAPGLTDAELRALRERTIREARAIAMLDHPNVVRIFDVVFDRGEPWIVMELVPSRSLFDTVRDDGPMSPDRAARVGLGVLAALRAAHRTGLLHRDVKPGNVLLAHDGRVVLTDFGLATAAGDAGITSTGVVLGSPQYLAPERALDGEIGPPADLWSLGATLYAAVEGHPPYVRSSPMATLAALATELPAPPERAGALRHALTALLQRDPARRADAETARRLLLAATSPGASPPADLPRYETPTFAVPHQRTPAPVLPPPRSAPAVPVTEPGPPVPQAPVVSGGPAVPGVPAVADPLAVLEPSPREPVDPLAVLAPPPGRPDARPAPPRGRDTAPASGGDRHLTAAAGGRDAAVQPVVGTGAGVVPGRRAGSGEAARREPRIRSAVSSSLPPLSLCWSRAGLSRTPGSLAEAPRTRSRARPSPDRRRVGPAAWAARSRACRSRAPGHTPRHRRPATHRAAAPRRSRPMRRASRPYRPPRRRRPSPRRRRPSPAGGF